MALRPKNTISLFNIQGERKYLNKAECKRYVQWLCVIENLSERAFCETVYATGCRISEALALTIKRINVEEAFIVFQSKKKRGEQKGRHVRIVPIKRAFAKRLNAIFDVLKIQRDRSANQDMLLWRFKRQKGLNLIKTVMHAANIFGVRATARGLRHSYGVTNILAGVPVTLLQERLGHADLSMTAIYLKVIGAEDRDFAERHWAYLES